MKLLCLMYFSHIMSLFCFYPPITALEQTGKELENCKQKLLLSLWNYLDYGLPQGPHEFVAQQAQPNGH